MNWGINIDPIKTVDALFPNAIRDKNREMQLDFAKNGLGWKIEDAARYGISPLAAIGSPGVNYSPTNIGDSGMSFNASMGQDLSRAFLANKSQPERDKLMLENASLQNDLLREQIKSVQSRNNSAQLGPGISTDPDYQNWLTTKGESYVGPTANWAMANMGNPFAGVAHMIRNNILPLMDVPDNFLKGLSYRTRDDKYKGKLDALKAAARAIIDSSLLPYFGVGSLGR